MNNRMYLLCVPAERLPGQHWAPRWSPIRPRQSGRCPRDEARRAGQRLLGPPCPRSPLHTPTGCSLKIEQTKPSISQPLRITRFYLARQCYSILNSKVTQIEPLDWTIGAKFQTPFRSAAQREWSPSWTLEYIHYGSALFFLTHWTRTPRQLGWERQWSVCGHCNSWVIRNPGMYACLSFKEKRRKNM